MYIYTLFYAMTAASSINSCSIICLTVIQLEIIIRIFYMLQFLLLYIYAYISMYVFLSSEALHIVSVFIFVHIFFIVMHRLSVSVPLSYLNILKLLLYGNNMRRHSLSALIRLALTYIHTRMYVYMPHVCHIHTCGMRTVAYAFICASICNILNVVFVEVERSSPISCSKALESICLYTYMYVQLCTYVMLHKLKKTTNNIQEDQIDMYVSATTDQ